MSLLDTQNFLARLYTDEVLRHAFLSEPEKIGRENKLNEREIAELAAIFPEELNSFADSLFWKRLREVEKFLPLTRKVLGKDFEVFFRPFSQKFNPQTVKKHLEDSLQFCSFLQKQRLRSVWTKDLIKFERARLIFNSNAKNFTVEKFDYDIKEILSEVSHGDSNLKDDFSKKKTFAVWFRIRGKVKHFIF